MGKPIRPKPYFQPCQSIGAQITLDFQMKRLLAVFHIYSTNILSCQLHLFVCQLECHTPQQKHFQVKTTLAACLLTYSLHTFAKIVQTSFLSLYWYHKNSITCSTKSITVDIVDHSMKSVNYLNPHAYSQVYSMQLCG